MYFESTFGIYCILYRMYIELFIGDTQKRVPLLNHVRYVIPAYLSHASGTPI